MITGVARRRRFAMDQKLAVVAETMQPGMSISYVARRHGLSPSLVSRWRRLMSEGGKQAIRAEEEVVSASEARKLEDRVRELERLLGRKTMEVEILKEALDLARTKKQTLLSRSHSCMSALSHQRLKSRDRKPPPKPRRWALCETRAKQGAGDVRSHLDGSLSIAKTVAPVHYRCVAINRSAQINVAFARNLDARELELRCVERHGRVQPHLGADAIAR
jgi:transposase-like protein